MKNIISRSLAVACALVCAHTQAQTISNFYVFGDSLSDVGTYAPTTQLSAPGSGRFTTNPGLIWVDYLAQSLGVGGGAAIVNQFGTASRTPNGGTDYAQGGSRVTDTPGVGVSAGAWFTADPVRMQIDNMLINVGGKIDPKALVTVWAGANDIFTQYGALGAGLPAATAMTNVGQAASDLVTQVARLQAAGAQLILVNTVPDIGVTPFGVSQGAQGSAVLTGMVNTFNAQLSSGLAGQNVLVIDSSKLLNDMRARPAAYGFTAANATTVPACGTTSSLVCVSPANANAYLFADGVHPSSAASQVFAQGLMAGLQAPGQIGTLAVAPMVSIRQSMLTVESRLTPDALLASQSNGSRQLRPLWSVQAYTGAELSNYSANTTGVQLGNEGRVTTGLIGADVQVFKSALVGGMLSYSKGKVDFSQNSGGFKSTMTAGALYGTMAFTPNWYVNAAFGFGSLSYDNINRASLLGALNLPIVSTGSTQGTYNSYRFGGGYAVQSGNWSGGPLMAFTQEKVKVKGYQEADGPLSMYFGDTHYTAQRFSLGGVVAYDAGRVKPFARLSYEHDLNRDPLKINLGMIAGNSASVDGDRPGRDFMLASVGVQGTITPAVKWNLMANGTLAQKNINGWSAAAGLLVEF